MNKQRNKVLAGVIIALILTIAFWCGGNNQCVTKRTDTVQRNDVSEKNHELNKEILPKQEKRTEIKEILQSKQDKSSERNEIVQPEQENSIETKEIVKHEPKIDNVKQGDKFQQEKNKEENIHDIPETLPEEIFDNEIGEVLSDDNSKTTIVNTANPENDCLRCTLSVRCDTILNNITSFNKEKVDIVPQNGVVFAEKSVVFYEGESVFNLLVREMKQNKIHLEFERTPIENGAYIEGIANLYEFDCGELSGWMYKVNGNFPNYGCSQYKLKTGDKVEWVYTCDLGRDVGKYYASENN
ncbi:MAG: DUF4430 domain-containing protein [Clostridia bacterium]|nr:DUF4430 domain-containing protein [Clostridia bacterium]